MKIYQKILVVLALSGLCLAAPVPSENEMPKKHKKHHEAAEAKAPCEACEAIKRLEEKVAAQQAEIDALKGASAPVAAPTNDEEARRQAEEAKRAADAAAAAAAAAANAANAANSTAAGAASAANAASAQAAEAEKQVGALEAPAYIHYKGIHITPGGFLDADMVWRQHAINQDVSETFNLIPYAGNPQAHMSEFRGTGKPSRISVLAQGKAGNVDLTGYYETDFQNAAASSNENQSNSWALRTRQLFAEAQWNGWSITGGQTWSLLTANRKGIEARGEWLPATVDTNYMVGFTYVRQMTIRVAKSFDNNAVTAAFSVENPAQLSTSAPAGVVVGGSGSGSTAGVTLSTNLAPDLVAKVAFDPKFGHFEVKAIGRFFRDRVAPNAPAGSAVGNNKLVEGGFGASAIVPALHNKLNFVGEVLAGRGVARYGAASNNLFDVTFRPNDSLDALQSLQAMGGVEALVTPKLQWYVYGGVEYLGRDFYGAAGGYGNPNVASYNPGCFGPDSTANSACNAPTKDLVEGTTGFWYTIYKGSYGQLKYGSQYEWVYKTSWRAADGEAPKADDNVVMTSFRYIIP